MDSPAKDEGISPESEPSPTPVGISNSEIKSKSSNPIEGTSKSSQPIPGLSNSTEISKILNFTQTYPTFWVVRDETAEYHFSSQFQDAHLEFKLPPWYKFIDIFPIKVDYSGILGTKFLKWMPLTTQRQLVEEWVVLVAISKNESDFIAAAIDALYDACPEGLFEDPVFDNRTRRKLDQILAFFYNKIYSSYCNSTWRNVEQKAPTNLPPTNPSPAKFSTVDPTKKEKFRVDLLPTFTSANRSEPGKLKQFIRDCEFVFQREGFINQDKWTPFVASRIEGADMDIIRADLTNLSWPDMQKFLDDNFYIHGEKEIFRNKWKTGYLMGEKESLRQYKARVQYIQGILNIPANDQDFIFDIISKLTPHWESLIMTLSGSRALAPTSTDELWEMLQNWDSLRMTIQGRQAHRKSNANPSPKVANPIVKTCSYHGQGNHDDSTCFRQKNKTGLLPTTQVPVHSTPVANRGAANGHKNADAYNKLSRAPGGYAAQVQPSFHNTIVDDVDAAEPTEGVDHIDYSAEYDVPEEDSPEIKFSHVHLSDVLDDPTQSSPQSSSQPFVSSVKDSSSLPDICFQQIQLNIGAVQELFYRDSVNHTQFLSLKNFSVNGKLVDDVYIDTGLEGTFGLISPEFATELDLSVEPSTVNVGLGVKGSTTATTGTVSNVTLALPSLQPILNATLHVLPNLRHKIMLGEYTHRQWNLFGMQTLELDPHNLFAGPAGTREGPDTPLVDQPFRAIDRHPHAHLLDSHVRLQQLREINQQIPADALLLDEYGNEVLETFVMKTSEPVFVYPYKTAEANKPHMETAINTAYAANHLEPVPSDTPKIYNTPAVLIQKKDDITNEKIPGKFRLCHDQKVMNAFLDHPVGRHSVTNIEDALNKARQGLAIQSLIDIKSAFSHIGWSEQCRKYTMFYCPVFVQKLVYGSIGWIVCLIR